MPKRAKSKRYPIEISGVAWLDLLGYGSMLRPIGFDPSHPNAHAAVERLQCFQRSAADATMRHLHAMIMNDGVAYVRELSPRGRSVSYDFLCRLFEAFCAVNQVDQKAGYPGARMIIAVGPRMRISGVVRPRIDHLKSILRRFQSRAISPQQGIREAFRSFPLTGSALQLQANFAFTKAYLADQAGSRAGFVGPKCYVDATLFMKPPPQWVKIGATVQWKTQGLGGSFYHVSQIDRDLANGCAQSGICDALEIATTLGIAY